MGHKMYQNPAFCRPQKAAKTANSDVFSLHLAHTSAAQNFSIPTSNGRKRAAFVGESCVICGRIVRYFVIPSNYSHSPMGQFASPSIWQHSPRE
jgi:hypothetical protein